MTDNKMIRLAISAVICLVPLMANGAGSLEKVQGLDDGWRLWLDPEANWKTDTLYLPDEVDLSKIPVNPPTGGWEVLSPQAGMGTTLPATVEQYYWGKAPAQTPGPTPSDKVGGNGSYLGVSWWYRSLTAPTVGAGERVILSFTGARLRAEVYVNGKLCGYNIITEAPFTADITDALHPGNDNQLAVRITNPGGNMDWVDFSTFDWGSYKIPLSHGFGGINGGVALEVHSPVAVTDLAVFNTPDAGKVKLQAEVTSTGPAYDGPVQLAITRQGEQLWEGTATVHVTASGTAIVTQDAVVNGAKLWDIRQPELYQAEASLGVPHSERTTPFGFRWLTAVGVGSEARLELNGRRIVPISAISWGFWAPNGIFPDQAAADREVAAMKALGLDSIQNHRHMPKPIVLDTFDRAGFLRYCEPGAGRFAIENISGDTGSPQGPIDTSGDGGKPTSFTSRYELAKVLAMVREDRSHPSVSVWTLQNEMEPDLHNPSVFYVLRQMRALDPSRIILLKSGVNPGNQVWSLPYTDDWMHDDGKSISGWRDQHTAVSSAGVYQDQIYRSPTDFQYQAQTNAEISVWGELATGASPDDHVADLAWYGPDKTGYDRLAHETLLQAYNDFLDEYGFRGSFPSAEDLFKSAGNKHYFSAAHLLENARMSDPNDYIVLSGWESTAVENHSGLVDSLRLLKGDPSLLRQASAPEVLVVRPLHYVVAKGDSAHVDIHLINEVDRHGPAHLSVKASLAGAEPFFQQTYTTHVTGGDVFGQLLQQGISIPASPPGMVTISATLSDDANLKADLTRTEQYLVVDPQPKPFTETVAFAGDYPEFKDALVKTFGLVVTPFDAAKPASTILAATAWFQQNQHQEYGDENISIQNTTDPELFQRQFFGGGDYITLNKLATGDAKVDLYFAENYHDQPGQRVFDVSLNGQTVLKDFDLIAAAGGKDRALIKTFTVPIRDGRLTLSSPRSTQDQASIAALQVTDADGKMTRVVFRHQLVVDHAGNVWKPSISGDFDWTGFLKSALPQVHDNGSRLILLTSGAGDMAFAAQALQMQNVATIGEAMGDSGPSWLGFWYFGRKHWLLDGLPSDCVLDWPYQIANGNGVIMHGSNVEGVIGYGKNHDPRIGLGAAVITYGKGQIVFFGIPNLPRALVTGNGDDVQPVTATRIIYNALAGGRTPEVTAQNSNHLP